MAGSIIVSGSLMEIRQTLLALKAAINSRVLARWQPLMDDENWVYVTAQDDRVCKRICLSLDRESFGGGSLASGFPSAVFVNATTVKMNMHRPHDDWCRCYSFWDNAPEVVTERLRQELEEVAASV